MNYFFIIENAMPSCHIGCYDVVLRSAAFYEAELGAKFQLQSSIPPIINYVRDNPDDDSSVLDDTIRARAPLSSGGRMEIIYTTHPEILLDFIGAEAVNRYLYLRQASYSEYFGYSGFTVFSFQDINNGSPINPLKLLDFKDKFIAMCVNAHTQQLPQSPHWYFMRQNNIEEEAKRQQSIVWKSQGLCPSCGGTIKKGLFGSKCSNGHKQ
ncbi:MAG: hypothetical protein LBQ80_04965 [Clostridium sp.]|jgi:hypothetical protein|nr:hypothetical protein [Clostridium sp.]